MYNNCLNCKHAGNMCQMLVSQTLPIIDNLKILTNRSLSYMRYKTEDKIDISININCNGFIKKT